MKKNYFLFILLFILQLGIVACGPDHAFHSYSATLDDVQNQFNLELAEARLLSERVRGGDDSSNTRVMLARSLQRISDLHEDQLTLMNFTVDQEMAQARQEECLDSQGEFIRPYPSGCRRISNKVNDLHQQNENFSEVTLPVATLTNVGDVALNLSNGIFTYQDTFNTIRAITQVQEMMRMYR